LEFEVKGGKGEKLENPQKNPWSKRKPTMNSSHTWHQVGIEPRPHWWEVSALSNAIGFFPSPSQSATLLGYILLVLWKGWKTQPPAPSTKLIRFTTLCQPIPTLVPFDAYFAPQLSQSFYTLVYDDQFSNQTVSLRSTFD